MLHPFDFVGLFNQTVKKEIRPIFHQWLNRTENMGTVLNSFCPGAYAQYQNLTRKNWEGQLLVKFTYGNIPEIGIHLT